jgi:hypothetical protein
LLLAALVAATPAALPDRADSPDQPRVEASHWYGWQTLLTDVGAIVLAAGALGLGEDPAARPVGIASAALYFGGGPAVHFVHGRVGTGLIDLLLRVGLPATGGLAGAAISNCSGRNAGQFCGLGAAAGGLLLGGIAASVLDAAWLAREPIPAQLSQTYVLPTIAFAKGRDGQQHPQAALLARF